MSDPALYPAADPADATFSIGELAESFGLTLRAIRFYEDRELLQPRRDGQTRIYNLRDRARLQLIMRGKRLGFSLAEIKTWLDLYDLEDGPRRQYEVLAAESRKRIDDLQKKLADLTQTLDELRDMEQVALHNLGAGSSGKREKRAGTMPAGVDCKPTGGDARRSRSKRMDP